MTVVNLLYWLRTGERKKKGEEEEEKKRLTKPVILGYIYIYVYPTPTVTTRKCFLP